MLVNTTYLLIITFWPACRRLLCCTFPRATKEIRYVCVWRLFENCLGTRTRLRPIIGELQQQRTPQNNRINEQKQSFCVLHVRYMFLYISLPSSAKQQREMTNSRFFGEREQATVNFTFSFPVLQGRTHKFSSRGY